MKFDQLAIGLHCYCLDDFPVDPVGSDADSLLSCWTSMWHPSLLLATGALPRWVRLGDPIEPDSSELISDKLTGQLDHELETASEGVDSESGANRQPAGRHLILVPVPYVDDVDPTWQQQVETEGGRLLLHEADEAREALVDRLIQATHEGAPQQSVDAAKEELCRDFMALGFAYLQTELLTRHMHYSTQMSESAFRDAVLGAAQALDEGEYEDARSQLQMCFDLLAQERDHYYAVDVYLLDLSLVAPTSAESAIVQQLESTASSNLIMSAKLLETRSGGNETPNPTATCYELVRKAIEAGRVSILGGEYSESSTTLLPLDAIYAQLRRGLEVFQRTLDYRPTVFGRRSFGLSPAMPQVLLKFGFEGALHATFDGGQFPEGNQTKSRWEGTGGFSIDALMRAPLDATKPETFLGIASSLGSAIDSEHIATRAFVHWAGSACRWYGELQRVARHTNSLGRFVTVEDYFRDTYDPGLHDRFRADQYRSPAFANQVSSGQCDTISQWVTYWSQYAHRLQALNASTLGLFVSNNENSRKRYVAAKQALESLLQQPVESAHALAEADSAASGSAATNEIFARIAGQISDALQPQQSGSATSPSTPTGYLMLNSFSFPRRSRIDESVVRPQTDAPVYVVKPADEPGPNRVIADVPALGFSIVREGAETDQPKRRGWRRPKKPPAIAEQGKLRNEFLEAVIDQDSGGLRGLRTYGSRGNRLSQLIIYESSDVASMPSSSVDHSVSPGRSKMVADLVEVVEADSVIGRIESRGRLLDMSDTHLADYTLTHELSRGSRVVEAHLQLENVRPIDGDPWENYIGIRSAWPNEASDLSRGLNGSQIGATGRRVEAPLYLHLDDGSEQTTLLTGGSPYHIRSGRRSLDTVCIVAGETAREFRWGVGVDLKSPYSDALTFLARQEATPIFGNLPSHATAWFFHLDARNIVAGQWHPIIDDEHVIGLRVCLHEVYGKQGKVNLRSLHAFESARKIDAWGVTTDSCEVNENGLSFHMAAYEHAEIEALLVEKR